MTFSELCNQTFAGLSKMAPGSAVELSKTQILRDFGKEHAIEVCKQFIDSGNYDFEFSDDYKYIKRLSHKF